MAEEIRRIVTGHDSDGKAVVIMDGPAPNVFRPEARRGITVNNIWLNDTTPASLTGNEEAVPDQVPINPPASGAVFRIVEFAPDEEWIGTVDQAAVQESMAGLTGHAVDNSKAALHPLMHRTESIDYSLVMSGECYLVLDDSEILVKAGDVVVQRGTNHSWSNRSSEPCRIAFIMIDGSYD